MMLQDAVISEAHKICDVLHLPNRNSLNERDLFSNLANFIEYITFCLSAVGLHLLNEVLAD